MTTKYIKGNALDYAELEGYCMIHVCNNKGVFGGGKTAIATQVKERFPIAYSKYLERFEMGRVSADYDSDKSSMNVINLVAQDGYGARWKGIKYFKEGAFEECLKRITSYPNLVTMTEFCHIHTIVVPYKMGADRAGGDWDWIISKVEKILGKYFNILVVEYDYAEEMIYAS